MDYFWDDRRLPDTAKLLPNSISNLDLFYSLHPLNSSFLEHDMSNSDVESTGHIDIYPQGVPVGFFFSSNSEVNFRRRPKLLERRSGVSLFEVAAQVVIGFSPVPKLSEGEYDPICIRRVSARIIRSPPTFPVTLKRCDKVGMRRTRQDRLPRRSNS